MPTQSEENKQVIQHRYDALGRGDTDTLFARMHKGDPQERDCRVLRNMIFIASMGLAMILAAIFTTVLELPDFWRNLWLAICISFAFLFFVGVLRLGSELSGKLAQCKLRDMEPVGSSPETQVLGHGHEITQVTQLHSDYAHGATENGKSPMNPSTNGTTRQGPSQVRALIKEPTTKEEFRKRREEGSNAWRNDRGRATLGHRLGQAFKRILFGIGLVLILAVGGLYFFAQTASYESTDDAFVDGHRTNVAPKIAGRIEKVFIDDNQLLKKGDPIVEIDPRDYDAQLRQKQAALDSAKAQAASAQASVEQQIAHAKSLEATLDQDKADQQASEAQADQTADYLRRQQDLYNHRVVSIQDLTNSRDANRSAQANLDSAKMKVLSADAQVVEGQAQGRTYAALLQYVLAQDQENAATVESAQLNDSYTKIFAPESGRVTHKSVEPGDYVQVGQSLLALVPSNIYVTANFKEDQLRLMRPGQPVEIEVDALGGRTFKGHVDSVQMGSGAGFSLLPPENPPENYVKVVQRVPVKILFDSIPDVGLPLGPGDSVVPTVKVQDFRYSGSQLLKLH